MLIDCLDYMKNHFMRQWKYHHILLYITICILGFGGVIASLITLSFSINECLDIRWFIYSLVSSIVGISAYVYIMTSQYHF